MMQVSFGLCEVVFEKVEEGIVGGFRGVGVVEDEGVVGYESVGCFEIFGLGFGGGQRIVEEDVKVDGGEIYGVGGRGCGYGGLFGI